MIVSRQLYFTINLEEIFYFCNKKMPYLCGLRRFANAYDIEIPKGVIVAKRHIHMTPDEALALHVKDNDEVFVLTKSYGRALIYADVVVRVHRSYHLAMHVDTDEANAFNSDTEPYGVIVKFFDSNFNTDKWIEDELSGIRR